MFRTFTASAILALALTTAAQAGPAIVRFGDLDLSRPQDNRILNSRIQDAARSACAGGPSRSGRPWASLQRDAHVFLPPRRV